MKFTQTMLNEIILASKSKVRKEILDKNNISSQVEPSNVDEDVVKESLLKEQASPSIISKNLAELKANKVSLKFNDQMVLGADSVIDLDGELISKPQNREEAFGILKKLNGKKHYLVSSVCISKNGTMIWNYTDKAILKMKNFSDQDLKKYLNKITDEDLYAYNVYQIEGEGRNLFENIEGDENTIMGLPIKKIKEYLDLQK
jgi:septum formation protein